MIKLENVSFGYTKDVKVIDSISLEVKENTVNILLGLNASGKTTLLKLISGLLVARQGTVVIDEYSIATMSNRKRAKKMAYVFQRQNITTDFSVFNYLTTGYTNSLKFYEKPSKSQKDAVLELANEFNISALLNRPLAELSGGQMQIVAICKSLVQDSKYILLDEPTSALDLKNQHLVLTKLKEIASHRNKTVIMTTHNPNHALFLNATVFVIKDGKIHKSGTCNEIVNVKNLRDIYGDDICLSKNLDYEEIAFK